MQDFTESTQKMTHLHLYFMWYGSRTYGVAVFTQLLILHMEYLHSGMQVSRDVFLQP